MSSSSVCALGLALLALGVPARAERQAEGFAVERLYPSAPGGGWLVMDALDMHGGLGGALAFRLGYERNPLRVTDGTTHLSVVSDVALGDIGAAVTYRRWRCYLDVEFPLLISGHSGTVADTQFNGPSVDLGSAPDSVSDARLGIDVRIVGRPGGYFRLGAGAQLLVPTGVAADYNSDGTTRGMLRALAAGDARWLSYAAQLGVHIRTLDDSPTPGSPAGSELLFGAAAGAKLPVGHGGNWVAVVGPELFGASAFRAFDASGTALEGLLSGRIEGTRDDRSQLRIKLGVGAGLNHRFGAAEWRLVVAVELFGQRAR
jgi:hypothetical protein